MRRKESAEFCTGIWRRVIHNGVWLRTASSDDLHQLRKTYVTPSWYATKQETGKWCPTSNYVADHAYGPVEFFNEPERLLDVVTRLTDIHEKSRAMPWAVGDAPADFIASQLRGIVGLRIPVTRFEGKRKMSQNRPEADRMGVTAGLAASQKPQDREVAPLIPT